MPYRNPNRFSNALSQLSVLVHQHADELLSELALRDAEGQGTLRGGDRASAMVIALRPSMIYRTLNAELREHNKITRGDDDPASEPAGRARSPTSGACLL
jgi:hypothetical protein